MGTRISERPAPPPRRPARFSFAESANITERRPGNRGRVFLIIIYEQMGGAARETGRGGDEYEKALHFFNWIRPAARATAAAAPTEF